MGIVTRLATSSDLSSLQRLAIDSFTSAYASYNTEENMRQYLAENFSEAKLMEEIVAGQILLGILDGKMVAYAKLIAPHPDKIPGHTPLEIARLYTDTTLIGKGIGKQMVEAVVSVARERNCDSVCLDVWQKNIRAINFYQREGFRICGVTQFRLGDDVQDDFVMLLELRSH